MSRRSLRLRLLALALASISGALVISGVGLIVLFRRHVEQRIDRELETYVRQIGGNIAFGPQGAVIIPRQLADPRFEQPLSGLYWQVTDEANGSVLRSRSLWDARLELPEDVLGDTGVHRHLIPGPGRAKLIVRERKVTYAAPEGQRRLRIAVAVDSADVRAAAQTFARDLAPSLAVLGLTLFAAAWLQVWLGLRPLEAVRRGVAAIRSGARRRLPADYPDEVMPLVEEVNVLLDAQDKAIERARAAAGDLAHGLKTPLTVLGADARALRERGEDKVADSIEELTESMRRHIERALAFARLRRSRSASLPLAPLIERLAAVIRKTPTGEPLHWDVDIPAPLRVAVDQDDLAELFGNLLENAAKWAAFRVRVSASVNATTADIAIEDDGPGIPKAAREAVLRRGVRLDHGTPGSGLGLAIAREVLDGCGGALRLEESALGGLQAIVTLPSAPNPGGSGTGEAKPRASHPATHTTKTRR
ncbi:ATP-binding protein [Methylocapsa palsarum]|uniref:histidine kinase n=1 Tax=Methylocapsa palsarum TaxID=1612308 RepID=A0A1I4CNE9_9HYPH|nr:HAMP domain-containing sensor histidine kinase [Methylocapsa palsarum]SFK81596.1 Signal transduction histidine kinase [Methylocapsa palsarum]